MPSISPSNGDPDVLKFLRRFMGPRSCADPNSPECQRTHDAADRDADDELKREHHEYLTRMEDEIAVMRMRNREHEQ